MKEDGRVSLLVNRSFYVRSSIRKDIPGYACNRPCSCVNGYCDNHGNCICDAGWQGRTCNRECDAGYFGEGCSNFCGFLKEESKVYFYSYISYVVYLGII